MSTYRSLFSCLNSTPTAISSSCSFFLSWQMRSISTYEHVLLISVTTNFLTPYFFASSNNLSGDNVPYLKLNQVWQLRYMAHPLNGFMPVLIRLLTSMVTARTILSG